MNKQEEYEERVDDDDDNDGTKDVEEGEVRRPMTSRDILDRKSRKGPGIPYI